MTTDSTLDRYLEIGDLRFRYRDWGGSGPTVLLLHGLASTSRIWDLVAPLIAAGARVVALDQRGHGHSAKPDDGYDFATIVGDAIALIDRLGLGPTVVVGHSWGASVALNAAAHHPDQVAAVVLVDGGFGDLGARMTWEEAETRMAPPDLTQLTPADLLERIRGRSPLDLTRQEIADVILANFAVGEDGRIRPHLTRERHMRIVRSLWEQRSSDLYPRIAAPVLLAPARQAGDPAQREMLEHKEVSVARALELLTNGRVVWFDDSVHDIPLHHPERLAEAIRRFLRESL
jgi:pimeloyl-ACP methyl ester carboxylesterase